MKKKMQLSLFQHSSTDKENGNDFVIMYSK